MMFKNILLPTDGSVLSDMTIVKCVGMAKELGAKVTGLHVTPEFHIFSYKTEMLEDTRAEYAKACEAHAEQFLAKIQQAAEAADVQCETYHVTSDQPYEAIIGAAQMHRCDLIAMASHGRKGVQGLLLGSETQKVLTHSSIPVLVYR